MLERAQSALNQSQNSRVMLQLPTGGGKTRIAGGLLSSWLKDGRKAVWLTHRRELAAQTEGMLQEDHVSATKDIQWTPGTKAPPIPNGVVILMAQTVSRRTAGAEVWESYDSSDLMIIDEAHHATAEGWARAIKQWPGPVLGMTATPWRLSQREGFDHLFEELVCGPQVASLQSDEWLCNARVLSPPEDELIQGGQVDSTGEYSDPGIEEANRDRDIWTAGALRFWQKNGENRQTVVYAVSVMHAKNLADVFNDAGIPVAVLVAGTPDTERTELIQRFRKGSLKALVNVAVATEGFDLPDAACVLLTRPTMSLALYLQMVGRGLRPKQDSGDCVVLDMSGNSLRHGLPEKDREWSLRARGEEPPGDMPLIRCEKCEVLSHASSHQCDYCGEPFGEPCGRCGAWRAWKRWSRKSMCGQDHELVCDLCHYDAHVLAKLPVTQELEELAKMTDDDELSPNRDPFLKNMLEEERRRLSGTVDDRKAELRHSIEKMESDLNDDNLVEFKKHLDSLPFTQSPTNERQRYALYFDWKSNLETDLERLRTEFSRLESQSVDGQLVVRNVRERLLRLLEVEAREAGLVQRVSIRTGTLQQRFAGNSGRDPADLGEWLSFDQLADWIKTSYTIDVKPQGFRDPQGNEITVSGWSGLLRETAERLIREGSLTEGDCPIPAGDMSNKYVINTEPIHQNGQNFRHPQRLSNGLWLDPQQGGGDRIARSSILLVQKLDQNPAQFHVQLYQERDSGLVRRTPNQIWTPQEPTAGSAVADLPSPGNWMTFTQLAEQGTALLHRETSAWPQRFQDPRGNDVYVNKWLGLLREATEWCIREGILTNDKCPVVVLGMHERCLINSEPIHPSGRGFRRVNVLSNGLYLEANLYSRDVARYCAPMVQEFGEDPKRFLVQMSQ